MRKFLCVLSLALFAAPVAAAAQGFPQLTPDQMAQVQKIRDDAKTTALKTLSADHLTKVQAIITKFDAGGMTIPDAGTQIDAVLSADETKQLLDQNTKFRETMRGFMVSVMGSPPPGGSGPPPGGGTGQRRAPDAGRFLLQIAASPDALRAAMQP